MKILLITDIPPSKNYSVGLFLEQLCRFLPEGSVACFAVVYPALNEHLSPDIPWVPVEYCYKPRENWCRQAKKLGKVKAFALESHHALIQNKGIAAKAIDFGRQFGADAVWCCLQGQTMIRLALPVAAGLGVPLLTQVWDPPNWFLRASCVDGITTALTLRTFAKAVRSSAGCATASQAMARQYRQDYGARTAALLPSLPESAALAPATQIHQNKELVIGVAGTVYAVKEWNTLAAALERVNWQICGRDVKVRFMGRPFPGVRMNENMPLEFLGWRPQAETLRLLSEADVLYCPYWFDPAFELQARLSFPAKLTTYLASGRPVLFHGPDYAEPANFLQENGAGLVCSSKRKSKLIEALTRLTSDPDLYSTLTENGRAAFEQYLTLSCLRKQFAEFLQVDPEWLVTTQEQ